MKRPIAQPPIVHHTQLAPARDSFQTLASSDTATQYPRRDVRSEWDAEQKLEVAALEEHQEATRDPNLSSQFDVLWSVQGSRHRRVALMILFGLGLVAGIGTGVVVGVGGNKNDDIPPPNELFNVEQFREICENQPEQAPTFGGCFPGGQAGFCFDNDPITNEDSTFCEIFSVPDGSCGCPTGQLIEVTAGAELCEPNPNCTPVDLSEITRAPTGFPTTET